MFENCSLPKEEIILYNFRMGDKLQIGINYEMQGVKLSQTYLYLAIYYFKLFHTQCIVKGVNLNTTGWNLYQSKLAGEWIFFKPLVSYLAKPIESFLSSSGISMTTFLDDFINHKCKCKIIFEIHIHSTWIHCIVLYSTEYYQIGWGPIS